MQNPSIIKKIILLLVIVVAFSFTQDAFAASRFWVGGTGTWDASDTAHWAATSGAAGGQSVPGSSDTVTFDASSGGGTVTKSGNTTITSITMGAFTGTLDFDANDPDVTMTSFSGTGTGTRTLKMGTGTWTLTGNNATIWTTATATNFTLNTGNAIVCNYSGATGTRTITGASTLAMNNPKFNITAGTDTITPTFTGTLDFTGFAGTLTNASRTIYGGLKLSTGMTIPGTTAVITFAATSGTNVITSNGKTLGYQITFDGVGGTFQLGDDLNTGTSTSLQMTLVNGTFDLNNYNVTTTYFQSAYSNTRVLKMGSGTFTLNGTSAGTAIWNITSTNFTLHAGSSTIKYVQPTGSATASGFGGGDLVYNILWFAPATSGTSTGAHFITGSNTFYEFKDTNNGSGAAHSILFTAGTTQTISNFNVNGTSGNVITINSNSGSTATHALVKNGVGLVNNDYLNIQHSVATPASTWYAGTNSVDNQGVTTVGSGWTFTAPTTNCVGTTTGNWNTGGNWTGCNGVGGIPATSDNVTINASVTMTQDVNTPVLGSLTINGTLTTSGSNYSISAKNITINSGGTLTANGSTITLSDTTGILFVQIGTFTYGTSTVIMNGDASFTSSYKLTSGYTTGFYNLTLSPTLTSARTYTFGYGAVTVNGAFDSNPSGGGSARALTTILGYSGLTVVGTFTLEGTSSGTTTLDTGSGLNYSLTFTTVDITSGDTLTPRGSDITITGTTGNLITNSGTWTAPTAGTTTLSGNGSATVSTATLTFFNLTLTGTGTKTLVGGATTTIAGTGSPITVSAGTLDGGTGTISYTAAGTTTIQSAVTYYSLTVSNSGDTFSPNGTINGNAGGTLTITNGTFDTTASNYAINFGKISIANAATAILTVNASVITLTATSGTLFTRGASGVFTQGTSNMTIASASGTPTLLSAAATFHKLTINSTATVINAGAAITMSNVSSANKLYIQAGVLNDGGNQIVGTSNGTFVIDSGAALCIGGNASETASTCTGFGSGSNITFPTNYTNGNITLDVASTVYYSGDAYMEVSYVPYYGNLKLTPKLSVAETYYTQGALNVYGNLTLSSFSDGSSYPLTFELNGDLTVASGKTTTIVRGNAGTTTLLDLRPSLTDYNLSTGFLNVGTGGTLDAGSAASTITLTGTSGTLITRTGTITQGSSTFVLSGNCDCTINSGTLTVYNLTSSGTGVKSLSASEAITFATGGTLTVSGGTFDPVTALVASGTNTLTVSATIRVEATTFAGSYPAGFATKNLNSGSTVDYYANGTQTVDNSLTYYNLSVSTGGTKTLGGDTTASNVMTIGSGATLDLSTFNMTLSGTTGTPFVKTGTFTPSTGTVSYTGNNSGGNTTVVATTYYNLTLNNSSETYVLAGTTTIDPAGTLTITNGTLDTTGTNYTLNAGKISIANASTAILLGNGSTISLTATSGTYITRGASGVFTAGTSTVALTGNGDATINSSAMESGNSFYTLTSSGTGVKSLGASITVGGNLTVSAGTFDPTTSYAVTGSGTNTLSVTGTIRVQGTNFTDSFASFETTTLNTNSTVDYTLNGAQNISSTISPYYNLTASTGGTKTLAGNITVAGALTISAGTFSAGSNTITLSGTGTVFSNSGTYSGSSSIINLSDTSASAKTFAGGGSTYGKLKLSAGNGGGSYTISGSNTFGTFEDIGNSTHTINFTAGTTQTVTVWNVKGSSGNPITLQSTSAGTKWFVNFGNTTFGTGLYESDYLIIQDSTASAGWYSQSWTKRKTLTIDASVVANSNQTDFPLLISLATDAALVTGAQADGDDILFTSSDGVTKLSHEIEKFTSGTGELLAWVKIPTLSYTTDTTLYMYYGNASATSQQSATAVWDSNFKSVWHLPNGTTLTALDSTSGDHDGTIATPTATTGQIDGGASFNGSSDYLEIPSSTAYDSTTGTWSGWIKSNSTIVNGAEIMSRANTSGSQSGITVLTSSGLDVRFKSAGASVLSLSGGSTINNNTWHHWAVTFDGTNTAYGYRDGTQVSSGTPSASWAFSSQVIRFGISKDTFWDKYTGLHDEVHISNSVRSADWITTEYRNQNSPGTYQTLGGETTNNYFTAVDAGASSTDSGNNSGWVFVSRSRSGGSGGVESGGLAGTCADGTQNGNETGVDSGGRCTGGGSSGNPGSGVESSGSAGTCSDGIQNGNETGIDSGGRCTGGGGSGGGGGGLE